MVKLNIQLSEDIKAVADARAAEAGHSSLDSYLESLILADASENYGAPEHLKIGSSDRFVELIREGEASRARTMTQGDWNALRQNLIEKHAAARNE